ncbi:MAG: hypothetical protein QF652_05035 [Dehalococcoidia bacterium]|nr:hypothetical protein [Dehalococcoidia bacterium]
MSKLVQRLQRVSDGAPQQPLGFARPAAPERFLPLVLIALVTNPSDKVTSTVIKNGAEFVIVPFEPGASRARPKAPVGIGKTPWGIRADGVSEAHHEQLKSAGCDFIVIDSEATPIRLLGDEDVGAIAAVATDTEDRALRAIDGLPYEAALVNVEPADTLTVRTMLEYSAVATGLGQNLLVPASPKWRREEFEQLRDAGFAGIVVSVGTAADAEALVGVKDAIEEIPARSRRREDRPRARVSQLNVSPEVQPGPPEEPDDDPDDGEDEDY